MLSQILHNLDSMGVCLQTQFLFSFAVFLCWHLLWLLPFTILHKATHQEVT